MTEDHFVIIGNGPAGNQAALTLRDQAPDARVTLLSKDHESCYRPHLLPNMISGEITKQELYVCDSDVYRARGIDLRRGQTVVELDPARRKVVLDHKEVLTFSGLIIAVGGVPRIPEDLWHFKEFMFTLKTFEDAGVWMERLENVTDILIIGGDLTSLGLTRALLSLKKKVYFMLNEDAFWPMRADQALYDKVAKHLSSKGVNILRSNKLNGISHPSPNEFHVLLDNDDVHVEMIGAFFGLVPDVGFLAGSGLTIDRGVVVDEYLNTGFEGVYATGDCAQVYHPELRDYWVPIGYDNAVALGRIAAMNLVGGEIRAEVPKESIFKVNDVRINTTWWMEF